MRSTVEGLLAAGVDCDVLYVRGHRGPHAYALGCVALALMPWARPGKYARVHAHGGETAPVARCFHGAPVLASYWGTDILGAREGRRRSRLRRLIASRALRIHSLSLTATTTKTAEMHNALPRRVRARNHVIPDGVDRARFHPRPRQQAREALGWPASDPTVITVGRRTAVKRLWLAEAAAAVARRQEPRLLWRVISDVPAEDMPLYYCAADALLHTSASEGSPNVVKEALACGLPVVATPAGDISELLDGVRPGAVCPADPDALAAALTECLRDGRRSNGPELGGAVALEAVSARIRDLYLSLDAAHR
jgi:glycosyltransferase involved in cell wall biosynthesis